MLHFKAGRETEAATTRGDQTEMGIDTIVVLPHRARVEDVADVMGSLLGLRTTLEQMSSGGLVSETKGVAVRPCETPGLVSVVRIVLETPERPRDFIFHWRMGLDSLDGRRYRYEGCGLMARTSSESIALFKALASFFGGVVDFNDSDGSYVDYEVPERDDIAAYDGPPWDAFQTRKSQVQALEGVRV